MTIAEYEKLYKGDVFAYRRTGDSFKWWAEGNSIPDADAYRWEPILKEHGEDVLIPHGYWWNGEEHSAEELDFQMSHDGYWVEELPYQKMTWNGEFYCDGADDSTRYYPVEYHTGNENYDILGYVVE